MEITSAMGRKRPRPLLWDAFKLFAVSVPVVLGASKPNILVIVVDDMGWQDVGYHNSDFPTTNIDQMASEGVKLDRFYVAPTCTPTRAQLMTGRYNFRIGMQDSVIHSTEPRGVPLEERFLSQKLQEVGYTTAQVGKWHLGMHMPQYTPLSRGFDHQYGILTGGGDHYSHISVSQTFTARTATASSTWSGHNIFENGAISPDNYGEKHTTDLFAEKTNTMLTELAQQDDPWFIYLAFQAVHDPIQTSDIWYTNNTCADITPPAGGDANVDWDDRKVLCGMMAQVDARVGGIRLHLEDMGAWDNTVVVLFSDNGGIRSHGSLNQPLYGEKGDYWEGGVRVPAFIGGGYTAATLKDNMINPYQFQNMVHVTDIHSTLLGLAGYESTEALPLDGLDQWSAWTKTKESTRDRMVINLNSEHFGGSGAVRLGDYKLILNPEPKESSIYNRVKSKLVDGTGSVDEDTLMAAVSEVLPKLGLDTPMPYLLNVVKNIGERTDGECGDMETCGNLFYEDDFKLVREQLLGYFELEAKNMKHPSFMWADDGPLANPANWGNVWAPWRDEDGVPLAMYLGLAGDPAEPPPPQEEQPQESVFASRLQDSRTLSSGAAPSITLTPSVLGTIGVAVSGVAGAVAMVAYRVGRRAGYQQIYL